MYLDVDNAEFEVLLDEEMKLYAWDCGPMGIISADVNADGWVAITNYGDIDKFFEITNLKEKALHSGIMEDIVRAEGIFHAKLDLLIPE